MDFPEATIRLVENKGANLPWLLNRFQLFATKRQFSRMLFLDLYCFSPSGYRMLVIDDIS